MQLLQILTNFFCFLIFILPLRRTPQRGKHVFGGIVLLLLYALLSYGLSAFSILRLLFSGIGIYGLCWLLEVGPRLSRIYVTVWILMVQSLLPPLWQCLRGLLADLGFSFGAMPEGAGFLLFAALVLFLVYQLLAKRMPIEGTYRVGPRQTGSAVLLLLLFMLMHGYASGGLWEAVSIPQKMITLLAECYCVTFLYMQYLVFREIEVEKDLMTMNLLWQQTKAQYELSRENIALINRKTHDLKHQVRALREMDDGRERAKYLDEIDDSIRIYEAIVKTGSEVLDTILTEKSLRCKEKGIEIHCVADGSRMQFMDPVDLYTIFGNILDNAMEEVQKFSKPEERQIDVLIYVQAQFLLIHVSNPLKETIEFSEALPKTTKGNDGYHGFGLRSVRHTVQKYDGNMTIGTEGGVFSLKILLPLPT